jgi:MFS family permease
VTTTALGEPAPGPLPPTGWWQARVGGLPRPFWFLWAGTLVNRLGGFVLPFLALYLTGAQDLSVEQAGLVLTLLGLGTAVSQPLGGVLADRIGRRRTMVLGLVSAGASLLLLGAASGVAATAVAAFGYGVCLDLFRPAAQSAVADLVPPVDRPRAFALQFWAVNLGFAVATPLGGWLASRGYWLLFVLDAATTVAFALLILRAVPETRPVDAGPPGRTREVLADRVLLGLVAGVVGSAVVYLQAFLTLPLAFRADGLGPGTYGAAIGLNGVLIVVLQPLLLTTLGRRRRGPLLLVALLLQGAGFGLTAFADALPMHLVAITVWTLGEILQAGQLGAVVAALAPAHLRGRYMGAFGFSYGLAGLLAPGLGTQVLARLGEPTLWSGAALLCALSGVVLLAVSAAADRRAAGQPCDSPSIA